MTDSKDLWLDIPNCCTPATGLCTGGHPQPEHLMQAKEKGVRKVVNLCPPAETPGYDEAAIVKQLGMEYVNIPIAGPADLTQDNARALAEAVADTCCGPILVHCASGNRVGALFALKAHFIEGKPVEDSIVDGREHGLKAMEPVVRQLLGA
ncbi:MAG: sulfur transferase domain-containing protein [Nevskiales bacterium]|nr:sulfur transferase domain-containing protein [Nevskiales bacterium]